MINFINSLSYNEIIFLIIGFIGQGLFASRFIIQWIYSEKKEKVQYLLFFGILVCWWIWTFNICNI